VIRQPHPLGLAPGVAAALLGAVLFHLPLQHAGPASASTQSGAMSANASAPPGVPHPATSTDKPAPVSPSVSKPPTDPASGRSVSTPSPLAKAASADSPPSPAAVTVLLLTQGEQRGSGVLLHRDAGVTWLVTNRHVVDGHNQVCVRTADGRLWPGIPVLPAQAASLDLAFVRLVGKADDLPLALTATVPPAAATATNQAWSYPIVRANGYPVREERLSAPPSYREVRGLLLPLLSQPLEGGMQLASTSPVRKGMSGGGLFDAQDRLIGLNATHADPLWSAPLREENGKTLAPELNRQLELVALAIPVSQFLPILSALLPPKRSVPAPSVTPSSLGERLAVAPVCSATLW